MADDDQQPQSIPYRLGAAVRAGGQMLQEHHEWMLNEAFRPYREFGAGLMGATAPTTTPAASPASTTPDLPTLPPSTSSPTYGWNDRGLGMENGIPAASATATPATSDAVRGFLDRAISGAAVPSAAETAQQEAARQQAEQQARVDAQSRSLAQLGLSPEEIAQRVVPGANAGNVHTLPGGPAVELDYGPNQRIFGSGVSSQGRPNTFTGAGLPALSGPGTTNARMSDLVSNQLEQVKTRIAALMGSTNFRDIRTRFQLERQQDKLIQQLGVAGQIEHARGSLGEQKEQRLQTGRQGAAHVALMTPTFMDALAAYQTSLTGGPEARTRLEQSRRGLFPFKTIQQTPFSQFMLGAGGEINPLLYGYGGYGAGLPPLTAPY